MNLENALISDSFYLMAIQVHITASTLEHLHCNILFRATTICVPRHSHLYLAQNKQSLSFELELCLALREENERQLY